MLAAAPSVEHSVSTWNMRPGGAELGSPHGPFTPLIIPQCEYARFFGSERAKMIRACGRATHVMERTYDRRHTHACHATRTKPHAAPAPRLYRIRQSTRCGARLWQEVAQQRGRIRVVAKHHRAVSRDRLASLACCLRLGRRLTARAWRTAVMRPRVCSCTHVRFAMRR